MKRLGNTHDVEAVAREAAVLRHPVAADADARLLAGAWREWTTATLLTQLNGYVHDRKVTVMAGGKALSGPHGAFSAPEDEWRVDDAGRDLLASLFLNAQAVVLPTFNVHPCPSAVPPVLLLIDKQHRVRLRWTWQRLSESVGSAEDAVEVFAEAIARQSEGWLRIDEAAGLHKRQANVGRQTKTLHGRLGFCTGTVLASPPAGGAGAAHGKRHFLATGMGHRP